MFLEQEAEKLYEKFAERVYASPSLENKVKELIAMSCSVLADCPPCIEYHGAKATAAGATKDEIHEALAISMTIAAGSKKAKYTSIVNGLLKE